MFFLISAPTSYLRCPTHFECCPILPFRCVWAMELKKNYIYVHVWHHHFNPQRTQYLYTWSNVGTCTKMPGPISIGLYDFIDVTLNIPAWNRFLYLTAGPLSTLRSILFLVKYRAKAWSLRWSALWSLMCTKLERISGSPTGLSSCFHPIKNGKHGQ